MLRLSSLSRNLLILHATVFVWGFTGILGALISIPATQLVWYRVLIASITLYIYFKASKTDFRVSRQAFIRLFFTGAIVAIHWIMFFQSIKVSTVSVGLVCLSSITLFTAILEPILNQKRVSSVEIIIGLLIITGIYLIFKFESRYSLGIICGLISAFCASLFSIINSKQIKNRTAPVIAYYEMIGAWVWISLYLTFTTPLNFHLSLPFSDIIYLLILGTICTSMAYVAGVAVMKELTAFRVALITNLEPIYAIILAFILFGKREQMTTGFYLGSVIILASIFLYPILKVRLEKLKLQKKSATNFKSNNNPSCYTKNK